ncbi:MAG: hypothetical protein J5779_02305 [Clostridia bacterium]|nr:hypothetical protein [Clostridia bacterium]
MDKNKIKKDLQFNFGIAMQQGLIKSLEEELKQLPKGSPEYNEKLARLSIIQINFMSAILMNKMKSLHIHSNDGKN